ncbi:hypothetical protein ED733_000574 [Metarhizium rileyi]|uniref:Uncharacterized protein n=1 Tax=Metarhizium rileyi (strain RCEF 4871) TaxID=1649241 RepID=A0A5C6FYJ3_METRR|nr:hypothetical protein ED733_000574 [Metarhizium rileyi]
MVLSRPTTLLRSYKPSSHETYLKNGGDIDDAVVQSGAFPAEYGVYPNLETAIEPAREAPSSMLSEKPSNVPLPPLPDKKRQTLGLKRKTFPIVLGISNNFVVAAVGGSCCGRSRFFEI